jgi:hypothetical protein
MHTDVDKSQMGEPRGVHGGLFNGHHKSVSMAGSRETRKERDAEMDVVLEQVRHARDTAGKPGDQEGMRVGAARSRKDETTK